MSKRDAEDSVAGRTWVHVFEQDTEAGAVFRPLKSDIPLSRRPRERFDLNADGTGTLLMPGADDRFVPQSAQWTDEGGAIVVCDEAGVVRLRIVDRAADRLVVEMRRAK